MPDKIKYKLPNNSGVAVEKQESFFDKYKLSNITLPIAEKHIKNACIAGIISLSLGIILLSLGEMGSFYWIDTIVFALLVFGLYKRNTFSAVALFVYFLIGKIIQIGEMSDIMLPGIIVGLIFLNYFYLGMLGVIKHNRLVKKESKNRGIVVGILIGVLSTAFLGYLVFQYNNGASSVNESITAEEILYAADYDEGYKSGYTDGRSEYGELFDNYAEPATEERKDAYAQGYLDGFLKGCREGGWDCTEIEEFVNSFYQKNTIQRGSSIVY